MVPGSECMLHCGCRVFHVVCSFVLSMFMVCFSWFVFHHAVLFIPGLPVAFSLFSMHFAPKTSNSDWKKQQLGYLGSLFSCFVHVQRPAGGKKREKAQ